MDEVWLGRRKREEKKREKEEEEEINIIYIFNFLHKKLNKNDVKL
jgi:hypothetical protein